MSDLVTEAVHGDHVLLIGVDRQDKRNAWNREVIAGVCAAYGRLRDDRDLRVGVVHGHGEHFSAGLDLMDVLPVIAQNGGDAAGILDPNLPDPWDFIGEPCPKPIVVAVQGRCNTLGIELLLASQIGVAAEDTLFAQLEVARGIFPLGGGAPRLVTKLGKAGSAWLLTAGAFTAEQALAAGLVNEVVPTGSQLDRAVEIAEQIAASAPLGVQAALAGVRAAERAARDAAAEALRRAAGGILTSADALEGMQAMMERRPPVFTGR